jgi:DNA-binding NarL/FixJ family response regulator
MQDANGLDLLAQLKADPDVSSIPVLMLGNDPEAELERRARELGAYGVYIGPLDADKLVAALPPLTSHEPRQM